MTTQLKTALMLAAFCVAGSPTILFHAFFYQAERLVLKKGVRVLVHIIGASLVMVVSGFFIYYALPSNWQWVQWVNILAFVAALLLSSKRVRIWWACRGSDELDLAAFGHVVQFVYDTLGYNVAVEARGAEFLRVTIFTYVEFTRRFKVTDMDAAAVLREIDDKARRLAVATLQQPQPAVTYDRDTPDTAPVQFIKMMHDDGGRMLVHVV